MLGRGGSEAHVMWLIEGLKPDCDVTVVTTGGWDLDDLNQMYNTNVQSNDVTVRLAPFPRILQGYSMAALRAGYYQAYARSLAPDYDVCIGAYNCTDWGVPAIQCIADFVWDTAVQSRLEGRSRSWVYSDSILRRAYLGVSKRMARPSGRIPLRDDRIVANSNWTAHRLSALGCSSVQAVIPPPVSATFPEVEWNARANAFVYIGRIAVEKRIEHIVEVVRELRARGHSLTLHVAGQVPGDAYGRQISELFRRHSDWVFLAGGVSGEDKQRLLTTCRYGINAQSGEAFGISVAELVRAGCLTFAHSEGGQAEILNHPALLFRDVVEATNKIEAVLKSEELQIRLRTHLKLQQARYSHWLSIAAYRELVAEFLTGLEAMRAQCPTTDT
jgi:glycosyltransferase involved in cell wall biosynthesis